MAAQGETTREKGLILVYKWFKTLVTVLLTAALLISPPYIDSAALATETEEEFISYSILATPVNAPDEMVSLVEPGDVITYKIEVSRFASVTANGTADIQATIPEGTTYVS